LTYGLQPRQRFQSSPFLRAKVNNILVLGNSPICGPARAIALRLRQALPADTYLEADYRRYWDSWSIDSNTLSVGLSHYFRPSLLLGVSYRRYDQTAPSSISRTTTGSPLYYTADYRLAPFTSGLYGVHVTYTPAHKFLEILPERSSFDFRYERYIASTNFAAAISPAD